ncbi:MAG: exo-alpha-sialidase [Actinomycetota bacterium]|nr:exo-alpha-sialidase [Actinomycetota bacterium]
MASETLVLVGTAKGLFCLRSNDGRQAFKVEGPALAGEEVYATCIDRRGLSPLLLAGSVSMHWGPIIRRSDDLGQTWTEEPEAALTFPIDTGAALARIWQLVPGGADEPEVIYAGVEPAALFRSDDGGRSFSVVQALWDHPHRPHWTPGGGGLCLHTVLVHPSDPSRLLVAVSSAGVYLSDDAGASWRASNSGIVAGFLPGAPTPEFGQCVHKVARDAADPERLYLQHHDGIYRSDDGGGTWQPMQSIGGVDFGFPVVAHPTWPGTAYLLPLQGAEYRCTPEGHCIVWRTTDAGSTWKPLTDGLPQNDAHETVLRDGFTTDGDEPAGLYFGTRSGEVYGSADDGDSWQLLAAHLPPVLSIRAAPVG